VLGHVVVHTPATHACPVVHAVSHPPQCKGSVWVSEQESPHCVWRPGQLDTHMLFEQSPASQVTPHPPQLLLSLWMFRQVCPPSAPQSACPLGHTHTPAVHFSLPAQTLPHVPQLVLSVETFVQAWPASPPQRVLPPGQLAVQLPLTQASPVAHVVPHEPQFLGSIFVFSHSEPHKLSPD
jgi:hypothetical protein